MDNGKNVFSGFSAMSLKNKLTGSFVLMVLIPLLVVAVIIGYTTYNSYVENLEQQNISTASMKAKNVETMLRLTKDMLVSLADQQCFQDMNVEQMNAVLKQFKKEHPQIQNVAVAGLDGMQVARDDNNLFSIGDRDYFKEVVKGKDYFYNDAIISKATKEISFAESAAIKKDGKLVGVIYILVRLQVIGDVLNYNPANAKDDGKIVYLTDSKGNVMIHPDSKYTSELTNWKDLPPVASAMNGQTANLNYVNAAGDECIGASAPIEGIGWSVVVENERAEALETIVHLLITLLIICLVMLVIAFVGAKVLSAKLVGPLVEMSDQSARFAEGDLTGRIPVRSNDEIGRTATAFNNMADKVQAIIKEIHDAAENVGNSAGSLTLNAQQSADAAGNVAETVSEVASGMSTQSDNITAARNSVDVFFGTIKDMKKNTDSINTASDETAAAAQSGSEMMKDAISKMSDIEASVEKTAETVRILGENSQAIGSIVDTIVAIADQTNLLALNAAIEAARAGEAGRGFNVVADEVRKLAEESQKSAVEIKNKIESIQSDTADAIRTMEAGHKDVEAGTDSIHAVGVQFNAIQERINGIKTQVNAFQTAAASISSAASEIVDSVTQIDEVSRNTSKHTETISAAAEEQSAATEEIASSSSVLEGLAKKLQDAVGQFKI